MSPVKSPLESVDKQDGLCLLLWVMRGYCWSASFDIPQVRGSCGNQAPSTAGGWEGRGWGWSVAFDITSLGRRREVGLQYWKCWYVKKHLETTWTKKTFLHTCISLSSNMQVIHWNGYYYRPTMNEWPTMNRSSKNKIPDIYPLWHYLFFIHCFSIKALAMHSSTSSTYSMALTIPFCHILLANIMAPRCQSYRTEPT